MFSHLDENSIVFVNPRRVVPNNALPISHQVRKRNAAKAMNNKQYMIINSDSPTDGYDSDSSIHGGSCSNSSSNASHPDQPLNCIRQSPIDFGMLSAHQDEVKDIETAASAVVLNHGRDAATSPLMADKDDEDEARDSFMGQQGQTGDGLVLLKQTNGDGIVDEPSQGNDYENNDDSSSVSSLSRVSSVHVGDQFPSASSLTVRVRRTSMTEIKSAIAVSTKIQRIRKMCKVAKKQQNKGVVTSQLFVMWSSKCIVLLMDPKRTIFEFVPLDYQPEMTDDVEDLLAQIPLAASSDFRLRFQKYVGLVHRGREMKPGMRVPVECSLDHSEKDIHHPSKEDVMGGRSENDHRHDAVRLLTSPLVAIPAGYTSQQIESYSKMLLDDPKVARSLEDLKYFMLSQ
jgi:hypothetical protein